MAEQLPSQDACSFLLFFSSFSFYLILLWSFQGLSYFSIFLCFKITAITTTAAEIDFTLSQHPVNEGHSEDGSATILPALVFDPVSNGSRCESRFVSSELLYYYD